MNELNKQDEELQRLIFQEGKDANLMPGDEAEWYGTILKAVKEEPSFKLEDNFASEITKLAVKRMAFKKAVQSIVFKVSLSFMILIVGIVAFFFLANDTLLALMNLFLAYKFQILFSGILILAVQVLDRILLPKQYKNEAPG